MKITKNITLKTIHKDLQILRRDVEEIKEHMVDADIILTEEEKRLLDESFRDEKEGRLISTKDLRKELGI